MDDNTQDGSADETQEVSNPEPADKPADDPRVTKANTEAAKYRRELRDAQAELKKFREAEQAKADADKTEAERRTAAETRAQDAERKALRIEVAFEKGLTPAQAKRLVGATREELEADADEIARDFPVAGTTPAPKPAPKPDKSQGARGDSTKPSAEARAQARLERLGIRKPVNT